MGAGASGAGIGSGSARRLLGRRGFGRGGLRGLGCLGRRGGRFHAGAGGRGTGDGGIVGFGCDFRGRRGGVGGRGETKVLSRCGGREGEDDEREGVGRQRGLSRIA